MKRLMLIIVFAALSAHAQGVGGTAGVGGKAGIGGGPASSGGTFVCVQGGPSCTHTTSLSADCGGGNTGCTLAFGVNVTSGDTIYAIASDGTASIIEAPPTISLSDTFGSSWTLTTQVNYPTSGDARMGVVSGCAHVTHATGSDSVTVTFASDADGALSIFEVSGAGSSCTLDSSANGTQTSNTSPLVTGSYSTAADDLVLGEIVDDDDCLVVSSPLTNSISMNQVTSPTCSSIGYGSAYLILTSPFSGEASQFSFTGAAGTDPMIVYVAAWHP